MEDINWQQEQRQLIPQKMTKLKNSLEVTYQKTTNEAGLFAYVILGKNAALKEHERLCKKGILTRLFSEQGALRFGLAKDEVSLK